MARDQEAFSAWGRVVLHRRACDQGRVWLVSALRVDEPPEWVKELVDEEFAALFGEHVKFSPDVAAAIVGASTRFGVDAAFLAAIVMQESGGDTQAMRYEKDYPYLWDVEESKPFRGVMNPATFPAPDGVSSQTEWIGQHISWGCCQVMGAVARELCYPQRFLTGLCDPDVGIEFGARLIARIMNKHKDPAEIASIYNTGRVVSNLSEHPYVTSVARYHQRFAQSGF